jgi:Methyltransferase domain
MRPAAIELLVTEIGWRSASVVELGSGPSTVVLARAARRRGGRVISVEHDPDWAAEIRELLRGEQLEAVAEVIDAPLRELPPALRPAAAKELEPPTKWYDVDAVRGACPEPIELLVVDGPPAGHAARELVRAPALGALADLLAPECTVVLDDIARPAERRAAELWRARLGCPLEVDDDRRVAVLRRTV